MAAKPKSAPKAAPKRRVAKPKAAKTGEIASASGNSGDASATGDYGHASATGYCSHASATGYCGHASATGDCGWAVSGNRGRAKAGKDGVISILWWDDTADRPRLAVGYVGECGIKADTWYRVNDGKLVEA